MEKKRVLIGSPIRQNPHILKEFLDSLSGLGQGELELNYIFVDDNESEESSRLLLNFKEKGLTVLIKGDKGEKRPGDYVCDDITHHWRDHLIQKVAGYKNLMIEKALEWGYDYLFLVDSDLVLHPATLRHLVSTGKEIISEIFWTAWYPGSREMPNVWLYDHYDMSPRQRGEKLSQKDLDIRAQGFIDRLKIPGVYEVGGLGACTLLSRQALQAGISFSEIKNLTLWGEDRHFCVRANALGLSLWVDTHYPAYHIYRESSMAGVEEFKAVCKGEKPPGQGSCIVQEQHKPKLTLSMVMKNEANKDLARVLQEHRHYIDAAVVIDDGSTDNSIELCRSILQGIPLQIIENSASKFANEVELRKQQWRATVATNPEWILNLDADELFENRFRQEVRMLIEAPDTDVWYFRLYDFWDEDHYREDEYWNAHSTYRPFLLRYRPGFVAEWNEVAQHCGRFPKSIKTLPYKVSPLRLKHLGWADPKDRMAKYQRYMELDPEARYGWKEQYESILDPNPRLVEWEE